jgi:phenylpropionate dioxygenase-like ring-hydroxylating dioxygenase large terminal subunit
VREYHGLTFAYMGPPDRQTRLPVYDVLENLADGESFFADDGSFGVGGPVEVDFNWLQHWENVMDPFHVRYRHVSTTAMRAPNGAPASARTSGPYGPASSMWWVGQGGLRKVRKHCRIVFQV